MGEIKNPHDKIYKRSLGRKEVMAEFLGLALPKKVLEKLDLESLRREHESYVDESMTEYFTDLLYTLKLQEGQNAKIFFLLEHKSTPERGTALQVLKYMTNVWSEEYDGKKLPLIIPIVFYHGTKKWNAPLGVDGLIEGDIYWASEQIPQFKYYLYCLQDVIRFLPEMTISRLRVYIKALWANQAKNYEEFKGRLEDYVKELKQVDQKESWMWAAYLKITLIYILETADYDKKEIIDVVKKEIPERSDEVVTVADQLRHEGAASTLERLLENKFSRTLSKEFKNQLYKADQSKLNEIIDNIFEIEDLETVKEMLDS